MPECAALPVNVSVNTNDSVEMLDSEVFLICISPRAEQPIAADNLSEYSQIDFENTEAVSKLRDR